MSFLEKVAAAMTPRESEPTRRRARTNAQRLAGVNDWLELVLEHHVRIEDAFTAVKAAQEPEQRVVALRRLSVLLNAHSNAEESVIYPALARFGHKSEGMAGYSEQAHAKASMGELEYLDPMSDRFLDSLERTRAAVAHHMYKEESARFLDLRQLTAQDQDRLTRRFQEEFERYMSETAPGEPVSAAGDRETGPPMGAH